MTLVAVVPQWRRPRRRPHPCGQSLPRAPGHGVALRVEPAAFNAKVYLEAISGASFDAELGVPGGWICTRWNGAGASSGSIEAVDLVLVQREIRLDGSTAPVLGFDLTRRDCPR